MNLYAENGFNQGVITVDGTINGGLMSVQNGQIINRSQQNVQNISGITVSHYIVGVNIQQR